MVVLDMPEITLPTYFWYIDFYRRGKPMPKGFPLLFDRKSYICYIYSVHKEDLHKFIRDRVVERGHRLGVLFCLYETA